MIKVLYATGDSFAFGDEMGTNDQVEQTEYQKQNCYSGLIAKELNIETYINSSERGGSNERMYRVLLQDVSNLLTLYKPEEIFVTLGFSHPGRREFCWNDEGKYYIHIPGCKPREFNPFVNLYNVLTRDFHYDIGVYTYDSMIKIAIINFLKAHKIPHLLTTSIINNGERLREESHVSKNVLNQMKYDRFLNEPSFMEFVQGKYAIAPNLHPLEDGHKAWADHLLAYVNQRNLLDNSDL